MSADPSSPAFRPTYTRDQLALYVTCIAPHASYTLADLEAEIKTDPLAALSRLQLRQMAFNPWGNVALHYSWHRALPLDHQALFHKIVERKLGGYCMENNAFFSTILRSLGYQLYVTGARISYSLDGNGLDPGGFAGWQHEVIIVTIDGQKYLADVGFGSQPLIDALPLDKTSTKAYRSVPGAECRLVYRNIASNTDPSQKLWVFETRNKTKPGWAGGYCFSELEWLPSDFDIINYRTSNDPKSWFTHRLVLAKILIDDETRTNPTGTLIVSGNVIERRLGEAKKEVVVDAKSENERVLGLRTWFGIVLRPEEERGIAGMASEIRAPFQVSTT
ncbi:N-hydroxyarylamine O-acetyltransferase [Exophiala viscosa]|uniref:N-hydroxyarylamine O-acetyltransferase n=1 Tax=Exophiala viscosa TaxID=2486360 RepID=A0AAN6E233_9EURO|nr:N-hydroxyarylamine O-acetyltransferase [Exophiala viscosa]KAI1629662.1 N-hydroxyarylamine O-acetyltransferase [Exophiala viscosa]